MLLVLAAVMFLVFFDFELLMPMGPFVGPDLGIETAGLGRLVSIYTLGSMLGSLLFARFADRWPRRQVLLWSMRGLALGTLLCGLATSAGLLMAARVLAGLMAGPAGAVVMALVADVVPESRRGQGMGMVMSGYTVASVLGLPLAVLAAGHVGWRPPFIVLAALAALVLWQASRRLPDPPVADASPSLPPWVPPSTPAMRLAWLGVALFMCADFCFVPFLPGFFTANLGLDKADLGWCYLAGGITTFFTFRYSGRLSDRYGSFPIVLIFSVLATLAIVGTFAVMRGPLSRWQGMLLMASIFLFNAPRVLAAFALFSKAPAPEHQGAFQSFQTVVQHGTIGVITWAMAALLAGGVAGQLTHVNRMLEVYVTAMLISVVVIWRLEALVRGERNKEADPAPS